MPVIIAMILLAIIQGLTEFLPVSSSGHLVFFENVFHESFQFKGLDPHLVNVILHFGTMTATIVIFWREILEIFKAVFSKRLFKVANYSELKQDNDLWLAFIIIVGTIPTGLLGIFFRDEFKLLESNLFLVGFAFITTGFIIFSTKFVKKSNKDEYNQITIIDSLILGFVQGLAITPGISRSGITISTGLWKGIDRKKIGHFSFLLSLPAIAGATLLETLKIESTDINYTLLIIGFIVSFASGYIALKWLLMFVNKGKLHMFTFYCWLIGILSLILA